MRQAGFSLCCLNLTHSASPGNPLLFHAAGLHGLAAKVSDSIEAATVVWLLMCLCVYTHVSDLTLWLVVYLQKARRYNSIGVCLLTVYLLTMSNYNDYQFYKQGEKNFKVIQHMKNLKSINN